MAVALRVGEALEREHAGAFAPADAVGARAEGLAAPVRGQPALARELDEQERRRHHGRAARQRQRALAGAQRLAREVQGDQ